MTEEEQDEETVKINKDEESVKKNQVEEIKTETEYINTKDEIIEEEIKTEKEEENNDNIDEEINIDNDEKEKFELKEKIGRFKPKVKLNMKKQRYPYCIVWTPLPCFTWIFPSIGHVGICDSRGIIHDFAGPYYVSIDNMAFGNPTKYILLDLDSREFDEYDGAIEGGTQDYSEKMYSLIFNNCHSYVARCLNKLKYKGNTGYTMIHVWWMLCIKSRYLSIGKFFQTYIGFFIVLIIAIGLYFLFRQ